MKKIDIEAKLFMYILHLKEEKNKEYSIKECEKNLVYIFENNKEFKAYFTQNGINDIDNDLLKLCKMKTTKKGTIIASKELCNYTIKRYKLKKALTQTQIDEIHARGKITPDEIVREWESIRICAPGDAIGSVSNRCHTFSDCHDCLIDYAYSQKEYDKFEFKKVNKEKISQSDIYELNEDKLFTVNPNDVIDFLALLKSINGEAFLSLFSYFSHQLETNKLSEEQIKALATYLYDIKVFCSNSKDKEEDLLLMAKCTARKLILESYIDSNHIKRKSILEQYINSNHTKNKSNKLQRKKIKTTSH